MQEPEIVHESNECAQSPDAVSTESLESLHIIKGTIPKKAQHADDIVLTQCILCVLLVLLLFALHWLKPDWQTQLVTIYTTYRDADPPSWLDNLLQAIQNWLTA